MTDTVKLPVEWHGSSTTGGTVPVAALDQACDDCLDQVTFLQAALAKAEEQLKHLYALRGRPL